MNLHDAWISLRHGGNLLSPTELGRLPEPPPTPYRLAERLRAAIVAFDPDRPDGEALSALLDVVFEDACGLGIGWRKGPAVKEPDAVLLLDGTRLKPQRVWETAAGDTLPLFTTYSPRIGVGKGKQAAAHVVEYLRRRRATLALLTNGREWRLVWADADNLAWVEWDADRWLDADQLSDTFQLLRRIVARPVLDRDTAERGLLLEAIRATRRGQAKLSSDLGERVRRAVEILLRGRLPVLAPTWDPNASSDVYNAACHFIMRLVVILFAEARELFPVDNQVYHQAYGIGGLFDRLGRHTAERRRERKSAWNQLRALFTLLHQGSPHPALNLPEYGGDLFKPGDPDGNGLQRALARIESLDHSPSDDTIYRILELITRTRQQGMPTPVNFTELTSEYIGILYEGLLDYQLHRAGDQPVVFLNLGNQPALPLDQLEGMKDKDLAALVEKAKVTSKPSGEDEAEGEGEDAEEVDVEGDEDTETSEDAPVESDSPEAPEAPEGDQFTEARRRALEWSRRAVLAGKLVKKPAGRNAERNREYLDELDRVALQLVPDTNIKLPGELYLVRWGGTRKGAGSFYTRPQLTQPTVRRTLEPLTHDAEGRVRPPEALLDLKICDPAMGSGSFLVAALRVLTELVVESLRVHKRVHAVNGHTMVDCDRLPDADRDLATDNFDDRLAAFVRRAVVERCLYGVDINPLATELGRVALWVETLDRTLPFTFLDHKLRGGDALVGAWIDRFRDYPLLAWWRQSPDEKWRGVTHEGDTWAGVLKNKRKVILEQQVERISGQQRTDAAEVSDDAIEKALARVRELYRRLRDVPASQPDKREKLWRTQVAPDPELARVREALDLWCALWFWPLDQLDVAPTPATLPAPSEAARAIARDLRNSRRFFHWELEFPDVFNQKGAGFDAIVGNPPWEIRKPSSKEFFSDLDPLKGSAGALQIDSSKLLMHRHNGRYRCEKCRRTTVRKGPTGICMAWRCGGRVAWETEDSDDFNLRVLDGDYAMLRVSEHSAQVPHEKRERIENQFKGDAEQLNTLVCTPTLELGVDIGALDAVLMRNVPPTAANYWQRAGRAGRRHRMAVDVTYAQAIGFDQAYFRDPLKLLGGQVEPPRFNLKNGVMIRKHVHATVLTALHGIAHGADLATKQAIESTLSRCFPPLLSPYLFTPGGEILSSVLDVSELGALIAVNRTAVLAAVTCAFTDAWPAEDAAAVTPAVIERVLEEMPASLRAVLRRFKRRLDWAVGEIQRLAAIKHRKGTLDPEDKAHERRCEKIIARFKGTANYRRRSAQGGPEDSETMAALAREGFLPGYGLESGSIVGTAEPPRMTDGLDDFELPRPPTLALREYVPGNAIYANAFRFVPRRYQLTPEETLRFHVAVEHQVVQEIGVETVAPLGQREIRAVHICDVILPSQSQISDEEEFRFQMPVAVYGSDRGFHRGGTAWTWGDLDIRFRRGVYLRLVNVGPRKAGLGFPLCLACGQSHSPFASQLSREEFEKTHLERCNHSVKPTGFFADVEVDVLEWHDVDDRAVGFSVAEAIRMGAARVLDMEVEDLQVLAIGQIGADRCHVLLYDPMPGGSGLLEQLTARWGEVRAAALGLLEQCPGACETSCIDCLRTYRNRFYHEYLNRHIAHTVLSSADGPLVKSRDIPEDLPATQSTTGQPQTHIETRFKRLLAAAGLPAPRCQHRIELGAGYGSTIPDFFYEGEDEHEPGLCIYLDGMAGHIHGNPETAEKDRIIRAKLDTLDYQWIAVTSFELDDRKAMVQKIARIAKFLVGKERQRELRDDTSWYDQASVDRPPTKTARPVLHLIRCDAPEPGAIPIFDLRIAASSFSDGQSPEPIGSARVQGAPPQPGLFVAQVVGDSMDQVAPRGAWCLWQHVGAGGVPPVAVGEDIIVRRPDQVDPELGRFTFKRLLETPDGRKLVPVTHNAAHRAIPLAPGDDIEAVARFVGIVQGD